MDQPIIKLDYQRIAFDGQIHLVDNDRELKLVIEKLAVAKELGFDTETKPSFKKGDVFKVALLQLSTDTDAYLFRLHHLTEYQLIKKILEEINIVKVGVAIRDDLRSLQKTFSFEPQNFIELQNLAKTKGVKNFGLKSMAEEILDATISKGPKMTNWELPVLNDKQKLYAATDAWIGLKLYQKLQTKLINPS